MALATAFKTALGSLDFSFAPNSQSLCSISIFESKFLPLEWLCDVAHHLHSYPPLYKIAEFSWKGMRIKTIEHY